MKNLLRIVLCLASGVGKRVDVSTTRIRLQKLLEGRSWTSYDMVRVSSAASELIFMFHIGKVFYLTLDGDGRMPVLHFGMTGNIHVIHPVVLPLFVPNLMPVHRSKAEYRFPTRRDRSPLMSNGHPVL